MSESTFSDVAAQVSMDCLGDMSRRAYINLKPPPCFKSAKTCSINQSITESEILKKCQVT